MKTIFFLLFLFLLLSCKQADAVIAETDFSFSEQQPVNDSKINHFPRSIVGHYINSDSTYLYISENQFIYKWIKKTNFSFEEFEKIKDSSMVVGNEIYYLKDKFCEFRKLKDSIEIASIDYDTIFTLSENQTAKKIKGSIILNTKDSIFWKVKIVFFDKNRLTIKTLASFDDLRRIDSLAEIKIQRIDSTRNIITLNRKEFKCILKLKRLGYDQYFKKLN